MGWFQDGYEIDGRWRVVDRLGSGRFGNVYKVEHAVLGDVAALKYLTDVDDAEGFLREVNNLKELRSPRVAYLRTAERDTKDDGLYIVQEFVDGRPLVDWCRPDGDTLPLREVVQAFAALLEGLVDLERAGLVHSDIKPENIVRTDAGAKLIDLGVSVSSLRGSVFIGGTLRYLPRDLDISDAVKADGDVDRFAAAVVLCELLWQRCERSVDSIPCLGATSSGEPVPESLIGFLARALSPTRSGRYTSAEEMLERFRAVAPAGTSRPHRKDAADTHVSLTAPTSDLPIPSRPTAVAPSGTVPAARSVPPDRDSGAVVFRSAQDPPDEDPGTVLFGSAQVPPATTQPVGQDRPLDGTSIKTPQPQVNFDDKSGQLTVEVDGASPVSGRGWRLGPLIVGNLGFSAGGPLQPPDPSRPPEHDMQRVSYFVVRRDGPEALVLIAVPDPTSNGGWVDAVFAGGNPDIEDLVGSRRLTWSDTPTGTRVTLKRSVIKSPGSRPSLYSTTVAELDATTGIDTAKALAAVGGSQPLPRSLLYGDTSNARNHLAVDFDSFGTDGPVTAYLITRVLPFVK